MSLTNQRVTKTAYTGTRLTRGLGAQWRVIHALIIREALAHHGHHDFGFFWIFLEPLVLMMAITVLWTIGHMGHDTGVGVIPFALTGYSFLTLWRHIAGRAIHVLRKNARLMFHRQVALLDVLIARAVMETLSLFTAFLIAYIPFYLLGFCPLFSDPLLLVGGFFFTGLFSLGFATIMSSLSEFAEWLQSVVGVLMYVTLPITGAFTFQEWLPESTRKIFSWSPLVNCVEMLRGGVFPPDIKTHWSLSYLIICCAVVNVIGLLSYSMAVKRMGSE